MPATARRYFPALNVWAEVYHPDGNNIAIFGDF
jgi:hypothetical protein